MKNISRLRIEEALQFMALSEKWKTLADRIERKNCHCQNCKENLDFMYDYAIIFATLANAVQEGKMDELVAAVQEFAIKHFDMPEELRIHEASEAAPESDEFPDHIG